LCKGDIDKVEGHRSGSGSVRAIFMDGEGREDIVSGDLAVKRFDAW
jgi:hypothetical protein